MEEEKTGLQTTKKAAFKIFYASYCHVLPKEILSFLKISELPVNVLLQDHILQFKENPKTSEIFLSIHPQEKSQEILCKAHQIDLISFEKFFASSSDLSLEKALQEEKPLKGLNLSFFSEEFSSQIKLCYVGEYQGSPLVSLDFQEFALISDALDEKFQSNTEQFLNGFYEYFSGVLDENALKYYLRRIISNSQRSLKLIDKISKKHQPEVEIVEDEKEKQKNLLFSLQTKEFYGPKMLELPKFNSEKGIFEQEEKIKLTLWFYDRNEGE